MFSTLIILLKCVVLIISILIIRYKKALIILKGQKPMAEESI